MKIVASIFCQKTLLTVLTKGWASPLTLVVEKSWVSHLCSSVSEREAATTSWDECEYGPLYTTGHREIEL